LEGNKEAQREGSFMGKKGDQLRRQKKEGSLEARNKVRKGRLGRLGTGRKVGGKEAR